MKSKYVDAGLSFEDFLALPEASGKSERTVTELAEAAQEAEVLAKKKERELKKGKRAR